MQEVIHVIVKNAYAASMMAQLQEEQAIEIIEEAKPVIPEWQQEAVRKTLSTIAQNPDGLREWEEVKAKYKR